MATRSNYVQYAFPQNEASLALATRFDFAAQTIYVPETSSRTFRTVVAEITFRGNVTTAASMTSWLIGVKLGAAAFSDLTITDTITNSGEQQTFRIFSQNLASYFNTNFGAGGSQTCQIGLQMGALATCNHTVILHVVYDFDDTSASTRVKTVRIPLESNTTALTATLASIGTSQIPNLSTFCPEASKTFRDIFFVIDGNESNAGTTDHTLRHALDAEAADDDFLHENGLNSSCWYRRVWKRTDMTTSATHDFKSSVSNVAGGTHNHQAVTLVVTYEYDHSTTTRVLNSILVPLDGREGFVGDTTDPTLLRIRFMIPEPGTITLKQSGCYLAWAIDANANLRVKAGSQTARTYTGAAGTLTCGGFSVMHRIDSGSGGGAGITIARGQNELLLELASSSTTVLHSFMDGFAIINYESDLAASGSGVHNHTIIAIGQHTQADAAAVKTTIDLTNVLPESSYFVTAMGTVGTYHLTATTNGSMALSAERGAGEGPGAGFLLASARHFKSDVEIGVQPYHGYVRDMFRRYPADPDPERMALKASRMWRNDTSPNGWSGFYIFVTYHAMTWTLSGSLTDYDDADGAGLPVQIFRADTDELVGEVTTSAGGAYTFTWYDDVIALYARCYDSANAQAGALVDTLAS